MKVLHTADWHLGKKLDGFSRFEEQIDVMNEIITIANKENVDMVVIAGDLFDTFNPAADAVELFYKTLKQLTNNGMRPVIAIGGNHDSPDRINAPDPLARECGIILIGYPKEKIQIFQTDYFKVTQSVEGFIELKIRSITFPIRILHTAYANEIRLKQYFGEEKEQQLNIALQEQWTKIANTFCDEKGVNILVSHLYMNTPGMPLLEEPDGEKPIKIGNADLVYTSCIPQQIQYSALGHLHAFNNIGTNEKPIVYASSPLCYSFSEAGQQKYVSVATLEPNKNTFLTKIPLLKGKKLERKTFTAVSNAIEWLLQNPDCLVELTIESNTFITTEERKSIFNSHKGIVHLIPQVKNSTTNKNTVQEINLNQDIKGLFTDYFKSKNTNQEPNKQLLDLFNEIINDSL